MWIVMVMSTQDLEGSSGLIPQRGQTEQVAQTHPVAGVSTDSEAFVGNLF